MKFQLNHDVALDVRQSVVLFHAEAFPALGNRKAVRNVSFVPAGEKYVDMVRWCHARHGMDYINDRIPQ